MRAPPGPFHVGVSDGCASLYAEDEAGESVIIDPSDRQLVAQALNDDRDAFAALMGRYERRVYAIAYGRLVNHDDAQEMTQQTFLHAYERLWQIKAPDRFGSWITRVALTCISAHTRRRMRETLMDVATEYADEPQPLVEQELFERDEDARRLVEPALHTLSESLRTALVLRYMSDATYDEIARTLMIPRSAAERRVQRGLSKLQAYFRQCGVTDADGGSALTGALKYPVGIGVVDAVMVDVRRFPPPPRMTPTSSPGTLAFAGVSGALITGMLATGVFLTTWAGVRGGGAAGDGVSSVILVGRPAPSYGDDVAGVLTRDRDRGPIPQNAILILDEGFDNLVPGQPLPGWTAGAYAQSDEIPPGGGPVAGKVNTNIPSAYYQFPLVRGKVTFELWIKPGLGADVNCVLRMGNHLRGWRDANNAVHATRPEYGDAVGSATLVIKNDQDRWFLDSPNGPGGPPIPIGEYDGRWSNVRLVYDTSLNEFDVYMGGVAVQRHIPSLADIGEGISCVSISSGRWARERDEPSYFDGVRVYVQPFVDGAT